MAVSLYVQALARAAEILGGVAALSHFLQIPQATVVRWITGQEIPTNKSFFDVVDLLVEYDFQKFGNANSDWRMAKSRRRLRRHRMEPTASNNLDSGESWRLVGQMDEQIERARTLLQHRDRALAMPRAASASPTLGDVLYAKPSLVIPEREWVSLIRSIASRDQRALQALYERVRSPVATLIQRIIDDQQAAEEVTVAVVHDVWRLAGDYDAVVDGTVVAWVMKLAQLKGLTWRPGTEGRIRTDAGFAVETRSKSGWPEPAWEDVAPGISVKLLATDEERHMVSMLVRLVPGGEYPAHTHAGVEELHLLEGELWIDERKLYPGDYNRAEPGTGDKRVWSETGCRCVLVTSTRDVLR